jgi:hypothetical protein
MDKYNWEDSLNFMGEYYDNLHLVFSYFHYLSGTCYANHIAEYIFLHDINAYREKDKWRDASGRVIHVAWSWNDDMCDFPDVYKRIGDMIYTRYQERSDMNNLYKLLAHFVCLYNDIYSDYVEPDQIYTDELSTSLTICESAA